MTNNKAPSVSKVRIDALVFSLSFETARVPNTSTTVATARLPNGFVVAVGENHTVHPANYDAEQGRQRAIEDATNKARRKLFELEGYVLARELHAASQVHTDSALPSAPVAEVNTGRTQIAALGMQSITPAMMREGMTALRDGQLPSVVEEKRLLEIQIDEMSTFVMGGEFNRMSAREQGDVCRQLEAMKHLSNIMGDRIAFFSSNQPKDYHEKTVHHPV